MMVTEQPSPAENQPPAGRIRIERSLTRPVVAYAILALTIAMYGLQELTRMGTGREFFVQLGNLVMDPQLWQNILLVNGEADVLLLLGGKINFLIASGQWWRLLTPALLHASLLHIGFNMYALYSLGPALEANYGHWRFLALYLISALGGNVLSFVLSPNTSIGASTAIFGLVAAEGVFIFQNRKLFGDRAGSMLTNLVMIIGLNLTLGLTSRSIDNWGHLGGLVAGLAFSWFAGPRLDLERTIEDGIARLSDRRSLTAALAAGVAIVVILVALSVWRASTLQQ